MMVIVAANTETVERTFSFIDLAGFTALTEAHGDSEAVAGAATRLALDVLALGPHWLRNVSEPVDLFEIHVGPGGTSYTVDPVCRMHIDREHAAGSLHNDGHDYWFCSLACVGAFAADPERYAVSPPADVRR
jgi:YHS domain-containing protein